ncbi:hypothetical protein [Methylobacterium sp.]|jgi:hypothetical protein|uniref:DUF7683 domain-containing protein n=1 Tax=Methylobacterium sp. TaxID=409 RepID=UPI00261C7F0A|nr:hypothetical protein [Methylobacterium sp.]MDB5646171.1 uncharacterized protein [Methylobacterium sp.]
MTIGHIVTGYDKRTQRLTIEHVIPESVFDEVRALADVPETDAEAIGSYPLSPAAVFGISSRLSQPMSVDGYDWFLEPVETKASSRNGPN